MFLCLADKYKPRLFYEVQGKLFGVVMTLEDLRIFVAVAEATSMGEVARTIGRSQPAVAQHVRRLEEELGASLVHRTPRGASLTEAGRILYERASLALRAVSSAFADIEEAVGRSE